MLLNVFPDVCNQECFSMDTESMCLHIENETHFKILDVVYYKRVEIDEMSFIFGKKLSHVIDKSPSSRLSVLKEYMCMNYGLRIVYCVYVAETSRLQGNCFGTVFDAVHSCLYRNNDICQVLVMSVLDINLFPVKQDPEREFSRQTKYATGCTEYEMQDRVDYEPVMLITIRVEGNVSEHTDFWDQFLEEKKTEIDPKS